MKKIKHLIALVLVMALTLSFTGCFVISAQKMSNLKGTYKLTTYTYTPSHERKENVTPKTYDYVNDEQYKYEEYLVITGTDKGYIVHKDASGESYVKEVTLKSEYSEENPKKIEYVTYNDSLTVNSDESGLNRLGVAKGNLNFNKASFDFTQLITKKPMRSEALSVKWEKVSKATDLSYASAQVGGTKHYKYAAFAVRGLYEINTYMVTETLEHLNPYQYFYIAIDTADGVNTANIYYATVEAPFEQIKRTVSFAANEDYKTLFIDGNEWRVDPQFSKGYYKTEYDIYTIQVRRAGNEISEADVQRYISQKLPTVSD